MIPFTADQFLDVFERYNVAVWPAQLFLYFIGLCAIFLALQRRKDFSKGISFILALFWLWMGLAYHLWFFTKINSAAQVFGVLFILQGLTFILAGVLRPKFSFRVRPDVQGITGAMLISYALIIYPLLGYLLGHKYPATPTFGVPCPTTIFTFGMLLWTYRKPPLYVLIIPLMWSLIGFWAAISLTMTEDLGLLVAGMICSLFFVLRTATPLVRLRSEARGR